MNDMFYLKNSVNVGNTESLQKGDKSSEKCQTFSGPVL